MLERAFQAAHSMSKGKGAGISLGGSDCREEASVGGAEVSCGRIPNGLILQAAQTQEASCGHYL